MIQLLALFKTIKNRDYKLFWLNIAYVFIFSILYYYSHHNIQEGFGKYSKDEVTFFDTLHFSFVTQTTNGYGDMYITSKFLKFINMIHLFGLLAINILLD
jgi:hypothetical protein